MSGRTKFLNTTHLSRPTIPLRKPHILPRDMSSQKRLYTLADSHADRGKTASATRPESYLVDLAFFARTFQPLGSTDDLDSI
ncbi:hypothetical protein VUR80DRAFT_2897 [Thermomyces stellatus]